MRVAVEYRSAGKDNYKRFCVKHPEIDITFDEWKQVLYLYMELFRFEILDTGLPVRLPCGFGEFTISKRKRKAIKTRPSDGKEFINLPIDWQKSKEKKKTIYIMNYHTEGYSFHWMWFRHSARMKYAKYWRFKATRETSRLLAHYLKIDKEYQYKYCEWKGR